VRRTVWQALCVCWLVGASAGVGLAVDWLDEASSAPYIFKSEFPLSEIAGTIEELNELQKDLESTLSLSCSDRDIHVHLFRTRFSYQRYVRDVEPAGVNRQALFVASQDGGRVYAYRHLGLETDLRHEMTHALLHNALPFVPLWLDEGLAEYFEQPAARRVTAHPHRRSVVWGAHWRRVPSLADLEAKKSIAEFDGDDYRNAWAWTHFLLHGPDEARAALDQLLEEIPSGKEPTPLSVALPRRLPNWKEAFLKHFR
jgi:hypothetical protein